jgi:hypothetical protein
MSRALRITAAFAATLMILTGPALAAPTTVVLSGLVLTGSGASWTFQNNYFYGSGGPCFATEGFQPIDDGEYTNGVFDSTDAFDGGLLTVVNGTTFNDSDGNGVGTAHQVWVGPETIDGLKVSRVERAFTTSPTLRSLVAFKNPTAAPIAATVLWDSAMGSDDSEKTRASSDGNHKFTTADLWAVTSDSGTTISDPAVTFVVAGPGSPAEPPAQVVNAPETADADMVKTNPDPAGCVTLKYKFKVPANSTRYLLFFTQMHASNAAAATTAARFTAIKPGSTFFKGLSPAVRKRILNFDLG